MDDAEDAADADAADAHAHAADAHAPDDATGCWPHTAPACVGGATGVGWLHWRWWDATGARIWRISGCELIVARESTLRKTTVSPTWYKRKPASPEASSSGSEGAHENVVVAPAAGCACGDDSRSETRVYSPFFVMKQSGSGSLSLLSPKPLELALLIRRKARIHSLIIGA